MLGDSPQQVGIATLPVPLGVAAGAFTVTHLLRHGRHGVALIIAGLGLVTAALAWIGIEARTESYYTVLLPGWAALGFGLAVSQVPLAALATANTSEEARGSVAGLYNMAQQVGSAIGLAAFNVAAVAYARGTTVADRLHGRQAATIGAAGLALATAILAGLTLRASPDPGEPGLGARHPEH